VCVAVCIFILKDESRILKDHLLGKSFNIYKPQVQGTSLSVRSVACRELCFKYQN